MTSERSAVAGDVARRCGTALCAVEEGTVTFANPAMGRLFDAEPNELVGERFRSLVAPDDRERVTSALTSVDEESVTVQFDRDDDARDSVVVEGTWSRDESDRPRVVGTLRDVTDRVRREARLERESEMLDSVLESIPMSIYVKDRQSRHERVSENMICPDPESYITNVEGKRHAHPDDVVGKTDFDLYSPELAESAVEEDREVMESEEPIVDEVTESTTNLGETFFSSTTKAPRYDAEGNVVGIVGVTMDVTDRMTYERELERQNERLEEFNEVLAHDLRNPLSVAQAHVELLRDGIDHPSIGKIDDSLDRMATLIDEIRSFVVEGRTVESPAPVDLATLARDGWEAVETADAVLDVAATHTIRADPDRLRRLLENVYRNAVEHGCPEGEGAAGAESSPVTVTVGDLDSGFYVADDGPGIPDDRKDEVFARGFTTGTDGTGFGLAIVRNIADAHDWDVAVTDSESGGARFEFTGVVRSDENADDHF